MWTQNFKKKEKKSELWDENSEFRGRKTELWDVNVSVMYVSVIPWRRAQEDTGSTEL